MRLTTAGTPVGVTGTVVGRVTRDAVPEGDRDDKIRVVTHAEPCDSLKGYRGVLTPLNLTELPGTQLSLPIVHSLRDHEHLCNGFIVAIEPVSGFVRTIYRPDSAHNSLFITERCSSNCLMCSQPPKDKDDSDHFLATNLELLRLIAPGPEYLGITGGEPTLLGSKLLRILSTLRDTCPQTHVHMLTNGRLFAWPEFTRGFCSIGHPSLVLGIPLYSDDPVSHDYIVQARHAFDQTVLGFHQLARFGQPIEIRVVLHKLSVPRLPFLAEFIYRNFSFVSHVALMGLEPTGYTPRNKEKLWIDPVDYQDELEEAVEFLSVRGMNVSLYNLQLCLLRRSLWSFARKSISDWKNVFFSECHACGVLDQCGGLFQSAELMHSPHIKALKPLRTQETSVIA
jgi:His-Xaa-Ser system radical SAM maturase HxsC